MSDGQKYAIVRTVEKHKSMNSGESQKMSAEGVTQMEKEKPSVYLSGKRTGLTKANVLLFGGLIEKSALIFFASNESKSVLARDLDGAKRQWRLFSTDRSGT